LWRRVNETLPERFPPLDCLGYLPRPQILMVPQPVDLQLVVESRDIHSAVCHRRRIELGEGTQPVLRAVFLAGPKPHTDVMRGVSAQNARLPRVQRALLEPGGIISRRPYDPRRLFIAVRR